MPRIDIIRKEDGTVVFDPSELRGAVVGEHVFWRNLDPKEQHHITRKGQAKDFWFPFPLAPFADGQPPDVSHEIVLQNEIAITYECALHPGEEGEILFSSAIA